MAEKEFSKIIYFDKETIKNILQEKHHGAKLITSKIDKYSQEVKEILDEDWRNNLWMTIFPLEGEYYVDRDTFCSKEPPAHKCSGQCSGCGCH